MAGEGARASGPLREGRGSRPLLRLRLGVGEEIEISLELRF